MLLKDILINLHDGFFSKFNAGIKKSIIWFDDWFEKIK